MTQYLTADLRTPLAEHLAGHCARHLQVARSRRDHSDVARRQEIRTTAQDPGRHITPPPGMRHQAPATRQPSEQDRQP